MTQAINAWGVHKRNKTLYASINVTQTDVCRRPGPYILYHKATPSEMQVIYSRHGPHGAAGQHGHGKEELGHWELAATISPAPPIHQQAHHDLRGGDQHPELGPRDQPLTASLNSHVPLNSPPNVNPDLEHVARGLQLTALAGAGATGILFSGATIRTFPASKIRFADAEWSGLRSSMREGATSGPPEAAEGTGRIEENGKLGCKHWAVVTTINNVTEAVRRVANTPFFCLVVVGDKKGLVLKTHAFLFVCLERALALVRAQT